VRSFHGTRGYDKFTLWDSRGVRNALAFPICEQRKEIGFFQLHAACKFIFETQKKLAGILALPVAAPPANLKLVNELLKFRQLISDELVVNFNHVPDDVGRRPFCAGMAAISKVR
jgi:hypothetical protein